MDNVATDDEDLGLKRNKFPRRATRGHHVFTGKGGGSAANTKAENYRTLARRIEVGGFLRDLREDREMTQVQVAEQMGLENAMISRWERAAGPVNEVHVPAYAKALDVPEEVIAQAVLYANNPYLYASIYGADDEDLSELVGRHISVKRGAKKPPRK